MFILNEVIEKYIIFVKVFTTRHKPNPPNI